MSTFFSVKKVSFVWCGPVAGDDGKVKSAVIGEIPDMAKQLPEGYTIDYWCSQSEIGAVTAAFAEQGVREKIKVRSIEDLFEELQKTLPDIDISKYKKLIEYFKSHNMHNYIKELLAPVILYLNGGYFFDTTIKCGENIKLPDLEKLMLAQNSTSYGADVLDVWAYGAPTIRHEDCKQLVTSFLDGFYEMFLQNKSNLLQKTNDLYNCIVYPVMSLAKKSEEQRIGVISKHYAGGQLSIDGESLGLSKIVTGDWKKRILPDTEILEILIKEINKDNDKLKKYVSENKISIMKLAIHRLYKTYPSSSNNKPQNYIDALVGIVLRKFLNKTEEDRYIKALIYEITKINERNGNFAKKVCSQIDKREEEQAEMQRRAKVDSETKPMTRRLDLYRVPSYSAPSRFLEQPNRDKDRPSSDRSAPSIRST